MSGGETRCSLSSSSFSPLTIPHPPPPPSPPPPRFFPPLLKVGAASFFFFCHRHRAKGGKKKKKKKKGRKKEGRVSLGTHGQLIVSGNVFHLHVYTVNSGGGLSAAAIPIRVGNCVAAPSAPDGGRESVLR